MEIERQEKHFELTLRQFRMAVGEAHVSVKSALLREAETATFLTTQKLKAVISPASVEETQNCLAIAQANFIPIYAVSRGRNCGYGSSVPYETNSVLLDLRRLNRIFSYDPELGTVRIQPGVTQEQLAAYLMANGDHHIINPVATFPDCSVIGNHLERGHGMTAYGDRISHGCDYEVVLPNGERLQTGYSEFTNARAAGLDRWAPGPQLDGLFSQSNLGVVTAMTLWLMPKPEHVRLMALAVHSDDDLTTLIELLRPLRLDGTLRFGPRFFNEYRLLQTYSDYPWQEMGGQTPLRGPGLEKQLRTLEIPRWTCLLGFYGALERIDADETIVRRKLGAGAAAAVSFDSENPHNDKQNKFYQFARASLNAMSGRVSPVTQRPRWRKRAAAEHAGDWSKDGCGLIWCPVTAPFRGADILQAASIYRRVFLSFGFEPDMSLSCIRDRTVELNASLVFDRAEASEERDAIQCANVVLRELADAGFYPHRLGLATMSLLEERKPHSNAVIDALKDALDPNGILADGRYVRRRRAEMDKR